MITPRDLAVPLERITWRSGQILAARDLRDDEAFVERLRHLHVRYQHKTWGIVLGLGVFAAGGTGLFVSAGYALDIEGRELIWPKPGTIAAPGVAAKTTMYLVISHAPQSTGCSAPTDLSTLCFGRQFPANFVAGQLGWKTVNQVRVGLDILLARVLVQNGHVVSGIDTSVQHGASSLYRPLFWADTTQAGSTGWQKGTQDRVPEVQASVDTSQAGFVDTPAYFASVTAGASPVAAFVSAATPTGFTLIVRAGFHSQATSKAVIAGSDFNAAAAEKAGWAINWFAIELPQP